MDSILHARFLKLVYDYGEIKFPFMPMESLFERTPLSFAEAIYGEWTIHSSLVAAKQKILDEMTRTVNFLRADAALFLLINIDYMVIRPYRQKFIGMPTEKVFSIMEEDDFNNLVDKSIDIIFETLRSDEFKAREVDDPPYSSHDVLRAIDVAWERLSALLWAGEAEYA